MGTTANTASQKGQGAHDEAAVFRHDLVPTPFPRPRRRHVFSARFRPARWHELVRELRSSRRGPPPRPLGVRATILGRDVKVELHDTSGAEIVALLARDRFDELDLWRGQTVWVRPQRERVFAK